jgi:hypothetical protein
VQPSGSFHVYVQLKELMGRCHQQKNNPSTKEQYKDKKNGIISAKCAGIQVANSQKKSVQP